MRISTTDTGVPAALLEAGVLGGDPLPWILDSGEPWARWAALTAILGQPEDSPDATAARAASVRSDAVRELMARLPDWGDAGTADHHSPYFLPNHLGLLANLGVRPGDDPRVDALLEAMLEHRDARGRLHTPVEAAARPRPEGGSVLCDSNAIIDVLGRFGMLDDPRARRALKRMVADAADTPQGRAWRCVPEKRQLLGGMRRPDACPQITLEGLRALSHVPSAKRPAWTIAAARTPLEFWRRRSEERPYAFGHGFQFKTVRWPNFFYDVLWVLETVKRFPEVWESPSAREEDRRSIAELAACLVAYNFGADGRVTPKRTHRGFERFSFGRIDAPSPYATARAVAALVPFASLAAEISAIEVTELPSALGGSGRPVPPAEDFLGRPVERPVCPVPTRLPVYPAERVLPRVIARHHLDREWEPQSIESIAADLVGLNAADPIAPHLSLAARMRSFEPPRLDAALDQRRSLVRFRCMRGVLYAVRRDFVPVVHAASAKQVVRYAREFAKHRGITPALYEPLAERILAETAESPLTVRELRQRLAPPVDLAAVVTLMCAEARLLRSGSRSGRFGRDTTYAPFEIALPDVDLGHIDSRDASAQVLRAYVRGFGPVTPRDAAWWTGMDLKRVRRALNRLEDELIEIQLSGREGTYLIHLTDAEELERASFVARPNVNVLPALDPLLIGYTDRSRFIDDEARTYVFDRAGNCAPTVLVDGRVAGVWDASDRPAPEVRVFLFAEPPAPVREVIVDQLARAGRIRLAIEDDPPVHFVAGMVPLFERTVGAYAHPLP